MSITKIFLSPIWPVRAVVTAASTTRLSMSGATTASIFTFEESSRVLGSLKELGVPLLFSIALQFGHSYAVYASERQPLAYILTLEWLMIAVMSFIAFLTKWRLYRWWPSINLFKAVTSPFGKSEPLWTNPGRLLAKV